MRRLTLPWQRCRAGDHDQIVTLATELAHERTLHQDSLRAIHALREHGAVVGEQLIDAIRTIAHLRTELTAALQHAGDQDAAARWRSRYLQAEQACRTLDGRLAVAEGRPVQGSPLSRHQRDADRTAVGGGPDA